MTLLPCTSPYSFGLVVSSTAFGGDLLNGVYSENSTASFTAFGVPGDVFLTVVQQEFGVTFSVSYCQTQCVSGFEKRYDFVQYVNNSYEPKQSRR